MIYVTAIIPESLKDIAATIGAALDPDSGGALSFSIQLRKDGAAYLATEFLCADNYYAQLQYLLSDPKVMHGYIVNDLAVRFPEIPPPTLEQCEQFITEARIVPAGLFSAIAPVLDGETIIDPGYEYIVPTQET